MDEAHRIPAAIPGHGSCLHFNSEVNAMDMLYLGLTVGFFALSWALIVACERLS